MMPPLPCQSAHAEGLIKWLFAYVELKGRKALFYFIFLIPKIIPTGFTRARKRKIYLSRLCLSAEILQTCMIPGRC